MERRVLPGFTGLIALAVAVPLLTGGCEPANKKQAFNPPRITVKDEKYDRVKIGMQREEVEKILGEGTETDKAEAKKRLESIPSELDFSNLLERATWVTYRGEHASYLIGYTDEEVVIKNRLPAEPIAPTDRPRD